MQTIAIFSDIHGNATAFKAMLADAKAQGATDYWFLGDLLMPGPGVAEIWDLLEAIHPSQLVRGNWDDLVIHGARGEIDLKKPSHVYFARLAQFVVERLPKSALATMAAWPLRQTVTVGKLNFSLSHNLPKLNMGQALFPTNSSRKFDQLFLPETDVALYAHVHHQLLRYGSDERIILNPGSVGEPFNGQAKLQADTRAQYLILQVDEQGLAGLNFRHVAYDRKAEWRAAQAAELPYLAIYQRHLKTGRVYTHNQEMLAAANAKYNYVAECQQYQAQFAYNK